MEEDWAATENAPEDVGAVAFCVSENRATAELIYESDVQYAELDFETPITISTLSLVKALSTEEPTSTNSSLRPISSAMAAAMSTSMPTMEPEDSAA